MIPFRAFHALVEIITRTREHETQEHLSFLEFYHGLVQIIPQDVARDFKNIKVPTLIGETIHNGYMMELTATDLLWWRSIIVDEGGRFVATPSSVQRAIWDRLNKLVRECRLSDEDKTQLTSLVFSGVDENHLLA